MRHRIVHADGAYPSPPIHRTDLPRTPSSGARERGAPSAAGCVDTNCQTPAVSHARSTLLDPARQIVAGVAERLDSRTAGHGRAMAPPMAAATLDGTFTTETSG